LFAWAAQRRERNPLPRPARIIAAQFGFTPAHANAVAELAGFRMERSHD
jgi:hypothetical protein